MSMLGRLKVEFSRFTVVGTVNFVFTFILFYIFVKVLKINYLLALISVSMLGMILTYTLNYIWVFKPEKNLVFKDRLLKYILSGFISILLNVLALNYIVTKTQFDPFYVQLTLIPAIVIFNFSTAKLWSLKHANSD